MSEVVLAIIRRGEQWLLQRRDPGNPVLPGLWEFPGGKVVEGESLERALGRELREETGLNLREARLWVALDGTPRLHAFLVKVEGHLHTELAWGWFTLEEMHRLPIPPRNRALIESLPRPGNFEAPHLI